MSRFKLPFFLFIFLSFCLFPISIIFADNNNQSIQLLPPTLSEPTIVEINLYINDILSINEREEIYEVDGYLNARWIDERQSFDPDNFGYNWKIYRNEVIKDKFKEEIWWPDLYLVYSKGRRETINSALVVSWDGLVSYEEKFKAFIKQPFSLEKFPFDEHLLDLSISSFSYTDTEVEFSIYLDPEVFEWETNEWIVTDSGNITVGSLFGYPHASYKLGIKRLYGFYISKFILPLILIVSISWAVFWMDYSNINLAERLGISFTSVLTVVAFDFVSSDNLPKLSYFTILDWILVTSYIILSLAIIENVLSHQFAQKGELKKAGNLDKISRFAFPFGYYLAIILIIMFHLVG